MTQDPHAPRERSEPRWTGAHYGTDQADDLPFGAIVRTSTGKWRALAVHIDTIRDAGVFDTEKDAKAAVEHALDGWAPPTPPLPHVDTASGQGASAVPKITPVDRTEPRCVSESEPVTPEEMHRRGWRWHSQAVPPDDWES